MRINEPVTGNRYTFPADQTLISVTDLKGRITYCNNNFVVVSGYTREELLGQPHNLIRHPDMPEEAFRDLWDTIEKGSPWTALVKNRRKNGDHYWVRANATPVVSDGRIVGYLSVRTCPKDEEVQAAEGLYAVMREEAARGRLIHCLRKGELIRNTLLGRLWKTLHLDTGGQLNLLILLTALLPHLVDELGAPWYVGLTAALVTAALAMTMVWRTFLRPLDYVLATANRIAAGDLARWVEVKHKGLIGRLELALAQMAVTVRTVVRDVRHEVANLRGGSQEIATGNRDMSARTESQASSLEQTAAAMEEINGTLKQTTQLATEGANLASEAATASRRSHDAVQTVASTMKDIAKSSDKIGSIIQVIEGVAFQTNLLALNAAVEAARAGEQGRGFAVVASEVRALAGRTSTAAREIRELIEESLRHVESGSTQTTQAQARMDETMTTVERTATLLGQIQTATVEQETGITQVNQSVAHLDSITQQNAAMVEELAAAAKHMDDQVAMVHGSIRVFRLTEKDVTLAEEDAVALRKKFQKHEPDNLPHFDEAISTHQQWRVTLRNAVLKGTEVKADELRRSDCCDLGQWLGGAGARRWSATPGFSELVQEHTRFHAEAGKVADAINKKQIERATKMLEAGSVFIDSGHHLTQAIRELRSRIDSGSGDAATMAARPAAALPAAKKAGGHAAADQWETF